MKFKLFGDVTLPTKSHKSDSGLDLYLPDFISISPFETVCVGLGLGVEIPEGYAGMLVPRSSISKKGLIIQTSIIDPGYTGEIHLIITNCSLEKQIFYKDSRLCSLVVYPCKACEFEQVDKFDDSERGENGLGSTGQ